MVAVYQLTKQSSSAFQFQPTLDGQVYTVVVTWNLFGRYYYNVYDLQNNLIVSQPVIGSPDQTQISGAAWALGKVYITTSTPLFSRLGSILNLTLAGFTPDVYNGVFACIVVGPSQFTYALASDPGSATVLGTACPDFNLLAGYFDTPMIFRDSTNNFEVG